MTAKEEKLFEALHNSRLIDIQTFQKRQYKGVWAGIIDKYPESAHFIYELLQNADDAEATEVNIILTKTSLIFKHNGKIRFSITDENDTSIKPGHINSITSIGDSTKAESNGNKIGKFGVGFKSVFQYTDVPNIYDDNFWFKIENYIVPTLLNSDFKGRKKGETVFYFPFKDSSRSYTDILNRLQNLKNPILFLSNLKKIIWIDRAKNHDKHYYTKEEIYRKKYGSILFTLLLLKSESDEKYLFHFSQDIEISGEGVHEIKVGYFFDNKSQKLITNTKENIYCFFPTKETFNTCYISHAPFKLVDSRQNIKTRDSLNKSLVGLLTELAADAIPIIIDYGKNVLNKNLIDSNIWEIIPVHMIDMYGYYYNNIEEVDYDEDDDEGYDNDITDSNRLLNIFVKSIANQKILLSKDGQYISCKEALTATPISLLNLLNRTQIKQLWGSSFQFLDKEVITQITHITYCQYFVRRYFNFRNITSEELAKAITPDFMSKQHVKWVLRLYSFLMNDAIKLWKTGNGTNLPFRNAPIILTSDNEWVSPYVNGKLNVFYPTAGINNKYKFVANSYISQEDARKFFNELGIKEPDKSDYIKNIILPKFSKGGIPHTELDEDFLIVYQYMDSASKIDRNELLELLKGEYEIVNRNNHLVSPQNVIIDSKDLIRFYGKDYEDLLMSSVYKKSIRAIGRESFNSFLEELGVKNSLSVKEVTGYGMYRLNQYQQDEIGEIPYNTDHNSSDYILVGFESIKKFDQVLSQLIWDFLITHLSKITEWEKGTYRWKYYSWSRRKFTSSFILQLKEKKWMYDSDGKLCTTSELPLEKFNHNLYDYNQKICDLLGIEKKEKSIEELGGTEKQQKRHDIGKFCEENDITMDMLEKLIREKQAQEDAASKEDQNWSRSSNSSKYDNSNNNTQSRKTSKYSSTYQDIDEDDNTAKSSLKDKLAEEWEHRKKGKVKVPHTSSKSGSSSEPFDPSLKDKQFQEDDSEGMRFDSFSDEKESFTSTISQGNNGLNEAKIKYEKEQRKSDIIDLMNGTEKYSFLWFKYLGELLFGEKAKSSKREIEINFKNCKLGDDNRVLVLSNSNMVIPKWIEYSDKFEVILHKNGESLKIGTSIMFIGETDIQLQLNNLSDKIIKWCNNCNTVTVKAVATQSIFNSLLTRFLQLDFEDEYDMNENLPENIEFIYGPPGTGKTTTLVNRVEKILEDSKDGVKILILTPTNKAADVIARKMINLPNCYDALSRFGATEDSVLIEEGVLRDRESLSLDDLPKNVIVTTAARYAYDGLALDNDTCFCDMDWDYVIIDEASMLDILTIVFILHNSRNSEFIISGDPKQIQPTSDIGINPENIYDMVNLHGFRDAISNYDRYKVTALMTQYRSVPVIGDLVSRFAYDGLLKSHENRTKQKPLILDGMPIKNINYLGFPVRQMDSLFELSSIAGSSTHLYSAIFTYNFARYIAEQCASHFPDQNYTIGIVCPYRKQADIVQQLIDGREINSSNCTIQSGTVHSFQGDECDIMILLMNPPAIMTSNSHILNENIINVGISRARDYLFIVTSDTQDQKFVTRNKLGILSTGNHIIYKCLNLENILFGKSNYIYDNTDVRCHLPVNVYSRGLSEYHVRISDDAIDIQIN